MKILTSFLFVAMIAGLAGTCNVRAADSLPLSQRAANAAMVRWPNGRFVQPGEKWAWNYELGTLLQGVEAVWQSTQDPRYLKYIQNSVDGLLGPNGSIPTYKAEENQLDNILLGRQLLLLYRVTGDGRYLQAAKVLLLQLQQQPRTPSGGYWHKQRYPNQIWLDGLYMAEPFYAEADSITHHAETFSTITHQFVLADEHLRDPKTGLLYHGWDESKKERWANKVTGDSPEFWARGIGWFMMALVDTLDYYPKSDPGRAQLIAMLQREAAAVTQYQEASTGLWYQVIDKAGAKGNYLESSAACMFVYALAKGVRRGYLPAHYKTNAQRGYEGIQSRFVKLGPGGDVTLTDTVKASGLGGDPYRDGTYAYYVGEKTVANDPKGVGVLLLAATEMEKPLTASSGTKLK